MATLKILHTLNASSKVKIKCYSHRISAGFPSPADDYLEDGIDINAWLVKHPASTFMMRVSGHSMTGKGILDGDMVMVDRSLAPKSNDVVVAVINGEITLKTFVKTEKGQLILQAANPDYPDIYVNEHDDLSLWGKVVSIIRDNV